MRMTWSSPQVGILIVEDSQPTISSDISSDINCENKLRHTDSQDIATLVLRSQQCHSTNHLAIPVQHQSKIETTRKMDCTAIRERMSRLSVEDGQELISRNRKKTVCSVNRFFDDSFEMNTPCQPRKLPRKIRRRSFLVFR